MNLSTKIVRNTAANYGGNLLGLVVGFLLTPFLIRSLGDSNYGAWVLVGSISSYFWMFDFGLGASVIKFVSELKAKGEQERLNRMVANSFALLAAVGVVAAVGCLVLVQLVEALFPLPPQLLPDVKAMIYITGVSLLVSFPFGVFGGVLRGYQRYDLVNAVGAASVVINALMSLAVVYFGLGLVGLSVVGLLTNVIVAAGRLTMARRVDPDLRLGIGMVSTQVVKEIGSFSLWVFVINVAVQVVYRTAPIIITVVLDVAMVTPYSIANGLAQYVKRGVDPILAVLLPAYTELSAADDTTRVQSLLVDGSRIVGAMSLPMVMLLFLLGKPFITLWVGPQYEIAYPLLCLLSVPLFFSFLISTGDKLLWAKGKIKVNSFVAMADSSLNLLLSVLLTSSFGVVGVGLATLISVLTTNGLVLLPYICREAGVPVSRYLSEVVKPILVPAFPSAGLAAIAIQFIGAGSYLHMMVVGAVCVASYWGVFLLLSRHEEKMRWMFVVRSALIQTKAHRVDSTA